MSYLVILQTFQSITWVKIQLIRYYLLCKIKKVKKIEKTLQKILKIISNNNNFFKKFKNYIKY